MKVGRDEIRFAEADREAAEAVATALPEIRRRGQEITGSRGPGFACVAITGRPITFNHLLTAAMPLSGCAVIILIGPLAIAGVLANLQSALGRMAVAALIVGAGLCCALAVAWVLRMVNADWPYLGGTALPTRDRCVISLRWPRPPRSAAAEELSIPVADEDYPRMILAHEYGHCLLRALRRRAAPAWLSEGFAYWFAEQVMGRALWRDESRGCVEEWETKGDPRSALDPRDPKYGRLMARYYWEVRRLAEEGRLLEALRARGRRLKEIRPRLHVED